MNRTTLFAALGAVALAGGVAVATVHADNRAIPLLAAGSSAEASTTSTTEAVPTTTVVVAHDEPSTTTTEAHTTSTTAEPRHEVPTTTTTAAHHDEQRTTTTTTSTTSTTVHPATQGQLTMTCGLSGADHMTVVCEWSGVPEHTARQVMMREKTGPSQPIWSTDDTTIRRYEDHTAEAGVTYSYRISAFDAAGTFLGTSNPVRMTPGGTSGGA
ncbi:MAG: hypothetical protein QOI47_516 [Actinomycetota bacterium]|nr:hypothetical protein [Actinomycetota bacterium]